MVSSYPSNVPPYNQWRYITPDSVDLSERRVVVIDAPFSLMRTILGAINLLTEIHAWTTDSTLTPEEIVDIINNEVTIVAICDAVAGCIASSENVQDEMQQWLQGDDAVTIIQNIIQQKIGQNGYMPTVVQANTDNDLDCVYGALVDAYELVLDAWLKIKTVADGAVSLVDAITNMTDLIPSPSKPALEGLDIAITVGTSAYDAWINSQAVQDQWVCGVFDAICDRGQPYTMQQSDIVAGFNAMTNAPIPPMTDAVRFATQPGQLQSYWALRTDDSCSNDWETKCNCAPIDWCHTFDFAAGQQGWTRSLWKGDVRATWSGDGWTHGTGANGVDEITILRPAPIGTYDVTVYYENASGDPPFRLRAGTDNGTGLGDISETTTSQTTGSMSVSVTTTGPTMGIIFSHQTYNVLGGKITSVEVCGSGTDPF